MIDFALLNSVHIEFNSKNITILRCVFYQTFIALSDYIRWYKFIITILYIGFNLIIYNPNNKVQLITKITTDDNAP